MCVLTLKISHRPDGKMADMPKSTLIFQFGSIFGSDQGEVSASHACKLPIAPMGDSLHLLVVCREAVSASVPARSR
jgi:hypothetical protein